MTKPTEIIRFLVSNRQSTIQQW